MEDQVINEDNTGPEKEAQEAKEGIGAERIPVDEKESLTAELKEIHDKYFRLYAEFDNYKKRVQKDKEEILRYGNENLLSELLPVIDHLEMALQHASNDVSSGLVQGVEITLRELRRTLEKFGLTAVEAMGKPFDPVVHHAMSQAERDDIDEMTVVEEFRKGYRLKDKVLRPSLVSVSKKPVSTKEHEEDISIIQVNKEEEL
jgi:molecular chaperone GrpE